MTDPIDPHTDGNATKIDPVFVAVAVGLIVLVLVAIFFVILGGRSITGRDTEVRDDTTETGIPKFLFINNTGVTINIRITSANDSQWVSNHSVGQFWSSDNCEICEISRGDSIAFSNKLQNIEDQSDQVHYISASDAGTQRVIFAEAFTHEQMEVLHWRVEITDHREPSQSAGSPKRSERPYSIVEQFFLWIWWLVLPLFAIWMGLIQLRYRREWLLMSSTIFRKKDADKFSAETLGIDSACFLFKTLGIGRVPKKLREAVESREGQHLLGTLPWNTRWGFTITSWGVTLVGFSQLFKLYRGLLAG